MSTSTPSPSPARINPLRAFAGAFTGPTFAHALTLVYGALPAPDRRTVASALRSTGRDDEWHVTTDHHVLNCGARERDSIGEERSCGDRWGVSARPFLCVCGVTP